MRDQDQPLFVEGLERLGVIFSREINDLLIDVYWEQLKGMDPELFIRAVHKLCDGAGAYFPKPIEIRKLAQSIKKQGQVGSKIRELSDGSTTSKENGRKKVAEIMRDLADKLEA